MFKPGTMITLRPKTKKGRERIKQHGDLWMVLEVRDTIQAKPGMRGPWLFITNGRIKDEEGGDRRPDIRWIHESDDQDFSIDL